MRRITLKDLAKLANVSPSTVSKALSNHSDISQKLKAKIQQMAQELHYIPNEGAVNLRKKKSKTIAFIIPEHNTHFIPSLIKGTNEFLESHGYKTIIMATDNLLEKEIHDLQLCYENNVEGILISLSEESTDIKHLKKVNEWGIPLVILDKTIAQDRFDEVLIADQQTSEECAEYLIKKGCKSILAVLGPQKLTLTQDRKNGFLQKLPPNIHCDIIYADNSDSAMQQCYLKFEQNKYDGIFMMSDEVMLGTNAAIFKSQITAPKSIAISDGLLPPFMTPAMPYVWHSGYLLGKKAAKILVNKIETKEKNTYQRHLIATQIITY